MVLHDGSKVLLSAASELVVPKMLAGKPRRVSLKGEAYFSVHTSDDAFIVSTEYADVEVVGTAFNVRTRAEVLEVGVLSGRRPAAKLNSDST
ncbi:MAG TPA: FecR family protein [Bacteroidota bacterium]|nr:FecR family protein [Bacteroidota bacterium]